ncbi:MAG: tetratricopeptide repeat protein [Proteobacteria bacterium]|nr:tetratricopeptide repeat protein [Pseudomonadota bacterium]
MNRAERRRRQKQAKKAARKQGQREGSGSEVQGLLQKAVPLHQAGRLADAEAVYRRILAAEPDHADANHLLGVITLSSGQAQAAVDLIGKSVKADPNFAEARKNLGSALMSAGRLEEAAESCRRAVEIKPDYAEAFNNLGVVLNKAEHFEEAERNCRRALELKPDYADAHNNLGNAIRGSGRLEEAERSYRRALEIDSHHPGAHNNLGVALHGLGSFDESVESYRQAIKLQPVFLEAHENLIKNRWSQGDGEDALSDLAAAAYAKDPMPPGLRRLLTRYLIKVENLPKAQEIIDDDPGFASSDAEMLCFQGNIHERNGDLDDAMEKYSEANRVNPNVEYEYNKIKMDFFKGKKESAINQIDGICNRGNLNHSDLLSFLALKGHMLKAAESEKYSDFFDYDTLVFSEKIDVPDGWSNLESFNAELALELEALHTGTDHPIDQTLRHGTQTAQNLFRPNRHPIIYALQAAITAKIEKYKRNLPADDGHAFLGNIPDEITYPLSWSVRLRSGGFHTNHIHPAGWLSSVYYVKLPPEIGDEEDSKAGWLKFGEPLDTDNIYNLSPDRWVKPEAGRLVLFPSYFWHGTEPFRSEDFRLTVAFDIAGKI